MYAEMYKKMKMYQNLADAELLCLDIQQRLLETKDSEINETRRNYLEYKNRANLYQEMLEFACKTKK